MQDATSTLPRVASPRPRLSWPGTIRDDETEAIVLAAILERGQLSEYRDAGLTRAHFYHGLHVVLWGGVERLETRGVDPDAPHLRSTLTPDTWDAAIATYLYTTLPGLCVPRQTSANITASISRLDQVRRCRLVAAEVQTLHQQPSRVDDPAFAARVVPLFGSDSEPTLATPAWPRALGDAAYYGLFGDLVHRLEPHTESDPAGLLLQAIVAFGSVIGRHAYFPVEADDHHLNLYGLLVGETSRGRKGTSWGHVRRLFRSVDEA